MTIAFLYCRAVGAGGRSHSRRGIIPEISSGASRIALHRTPGIVAHMCGDPLLRCTCRAKRIAADFLGIMGLFLDSH